MNDFVYDLMMLVVLAFVLSWLGMLGAAVIACLRDEHAPAAGPLLRRWVRRKA